MPGVGKKMALLSYSETIPISLCMGASPILRKVQSVSRKSIMAKQSIFKRLLSVDNTDLDLVTFPSWQLKSSMVLTV